jgi:hypothetical protein
MKLDDIGAETRRAMQRSQEVDLSIGALKVVVSFVLQRREAELTYLFNLLNGRLVDLAVSFRYNEL